MKLKIIILSAVIITAFLFYKFINYEFFIFSYERCREEIVDDCIMAVNKIDPEANLDDLHPIQYSHLRILTDIPISSEKDSLLEGKQVKDYIALPVSMGNKEMRDKARERIVNNVAEKWCVRPNLFK